MSGGLFSQVFTRGRSRVMLLTLWMRLVKTLQRVGYRRMEFVHTESDHAGTAVPVLNNQSDHLESS